MSPPGQAVEPANRLATILDAKRAEVHERRRTADWAQLEAAARAVIRRPFAPQLVRDGRSIIAEMKRRSPSKGVLREDYDPVQLAHAYYHGGARALSVLTDEPFFGGSLDDLRRARAAVPLPVLRKDFLIDEFQILESAAAGADAVLLIVAACPSDDSDARLRNMLSEAHSWGMDALVEVHNEEELRRALAVRALIIGVNNRDLRTFDVDFGVSLRLAEKLRPAIPVSESGLRTAADLARLEAAGYRAFLVGEQLLLAANPGEALKALLAA